MRELDVGIIAGAVARLCVQANRALPPDVVAALGRARAGESWPLAAGVLDEICQNVAAAEENSLPPCQDTGMACVFLEVGQEVHLCGGGLAEAVNRGVAEGYETGLLRKSVVADPLRRVNTKDNTPALLSVEIVPGDAVKVTVVPKGFGSENMSRLAMLKPADGRPAVEDFVVETVRLAGPNPCPPVVVGVGIGGSFDKAAALAKKALLRPLDVPNPDPWYAEMEAGLLARINELGTGPAGYGGRATALGLAIETFPTHIAGLPVAVNISCHVTRRASTVL
ncbi:fumarate hydratase [Ruminococcaceae bacterium OttesenSCG-928-D13]|nr:fumarate hydratase [Ruminococcaceae bacterium OttesenSCG-928-D13]